MRLLIISNRLPVSLMHRDGEFFLEKSAGGLVSGLSDYLESLGRSESDISEYLWLGWPGISVKKRHRELVSDKINSGFKASPVFLSEKLMDKVYLGFCNKTIWPLFHYFPSYTVFDSEYWDQYKRVNRIFRDELLSIIQPDDIIWVHDYHLMLLPELLREKVANPIGFFLHIPFPAYEIYRLLPDESRSGILRGLMGADLIGFHTHDYSQYFLRCVLRILGHDHHMGRIDLPGRVVKVDTFPMGIDYNKFNQLITPETDMPSGDCPRMVLSVDRLDYSKGILNRLKGFGLFLEQNPEWLGKVCLNMIVVPSRTGVESYQEIKRGLDELVGYINGAYGGLNWTPVIYQYRSLPHETLISLYRRCDVALLTPLRDGMNLVAKEYVASRNDKKGVLILSEFTGASKELSESIIVNSNSIDEIASAIRRALDMPVDEQIRRNEAMQQRLKRYDVTRWATDFVGALNEIREISEYTFSKKYFNTESLEKLVAGYKKAERKLIILNYDGTLVPLTGDPADAKPSPELLGLLKRFRTQAGTDLVILSGRSKEDLQRWLGDMPVNLTAEHGSWIRELGADRWTQLKPLSGEWKKDLMPILEIYTDRLPGARIKEKEFSVSWHYHNADVEQASFIAKELYDHLISITATIDIQVFRGSRALEISSSGINKGDLARHWLNIRDYDFILAIGAGWTDELLFRSLPDNAWSFKVGMVQTGASFIIKDHSDVMALLKNLNSI
ncbi:MAG: bifunctional alpha,alpha-trehalose-phosphate synthase (UDP-forming)/trehalose-phosphatase [Marinilabiliales bacterium]|nr:MAG: bifunctional alpha,alpha-trehalose-phosphate synthase (UDP-forming)/trehalose-phosphatase [Marinilabiliales bacterium]